MLIVWWNFYFLTVVLLHLLGYINASGLYNLLLFIFIAVPFEKLIKFKYTFKIKHFIGIILSLILFWKETFFPSIKELYNFLTDPATRPSADYLVSFVEQMINFKLIAGILILFSVIYYLNRKKIKVSVISFFAILSILFLNEHKSASLDISLLQLNNFYKQEKNRKVNFLKPDSKTPDFNIILIQICSFAWDDIVASKIDLKPLFSKFDYIFSKFNSATSYSVPAAIRLLRAPCGHQQHSDLFKETDEDCYLMEVLRKTGYKTYTAFNHDGNYYNMTENLIKHAKIDKPISLKGLSTEIESFDGTPIYNDYDVLKKWLNKTLKEKGPSMLFYNTISLHMGTHYSKKVVKNPWSKSREKRYKEFLNLFASRINKFLNALKDTGKNYIVFIVAEHGAAYRGIKIQPPDVRDIPFPYITYVPFAVKIIGKNYKHRKPVIIDKHISHLGLAYVMSYFIKNSPFSKKYNETEMIKNIPETDFVAETSRAIVMKNGDKFIYRKRDSKKWLLAPKETLPLDYSYLLKY